MSLINDYEDKNDPRNKERKLPKIKPATPQEQLKEVDPQTSPPTPSPVTPTPPTEEPFSFPGTGTFPDVEEPMPEIQAPSVQQPRVGETREFAAPNAPPPSPTPPEPQAPPLDLSPGVIGDDFYANDDKIAQASAVGQTQGSVLSKFNLDAQDELLRRNQANQQAIEEGKLVETHFPTLYSSPLLKEEVDRDVARSSSFVQSLANSTLERQKFLDQQYQPLPQQRKEGFRPDSTRPFSQQRDEMVNGVLRQNEQRPGNYIDPSESWLSRIFYGVGIVQNTALGAVADVNQMLSKLPGYREVYGDKSIQAGVLNKLGLRQLVNYDENYKGSYLIDALAGRQYQHSGYEYNEKGQREPFGVAKGKDPTKEDDIVAKLKNVVKDPRIALGLGFDIALDPFDYLAQGLVAGGRRLGIIKRAESIGGVGSKGRVVVPEVTPQKPSTPPKVSEFKVNPAEIKEPKTKPLNASVGSAEWKEPGVRGVRVPPGAIVPVSIAPTRAVVPRPIPEPAGKLFPPRIDMGNAYLESDFPNPTALKPGATPKVLGLPPAKLPETPALPPMLSIEARLETPPAATVKDFTTKVVDSIPEPESKVFYTYPGADKNVLGDPTPKYFLTGSVKVPETQVKATFIDAGGNVQVGRVFLSPESKNVIGVLSSDVEVPAIKVDVPEQLPEVPVKADIESGALTSVDETHVAPTVELVPELEAEVNRSAAEVRRIEKKPNVPVEEKKVAQEKLAVAQEKLQKTKTSAPTPQEVTPPSSPKPKGEFEKDYELLKQEEEKVYRTDTRFMSDQEKDALYQGLKDKRLEFDLKHANTEERRAYLRTEHELDRVRTESEFLRNNQPKIGTPEFEAWSARRQELGKTEARLYKRSKVEFKSASKADIAFDKKRGVKFDAEELREFDEYGRRIATDEEFEAGIDPNDVAPKKPTAKVEKAKKETNTPKVPAPPPPKTPSIPAVVLKGEVKLSELARLVADTVPGVQVDGSVIKAPRMTKEQALELMRIIPAPDGKPIISKSLKRIETWAHINKILQNRGIEDPVYFRIFSKNNLGVDVEALKDPALRITVDAPSPFKASREVVTELPANTVNADELYKQAPSVNERPFSTEVKTSRLPGYETPPTPKVASEVVSTSSGTTLDALNEEMDSLMSRLDELESQLEVKYDQKAFDESVSLQEKVNQLETKIREADIAAANETPAALKEKQIAARKQELARKIQNVESPEEFEAVLKEMEELEQSLQKPDLTNPQKLEELNNTTIPKVEQTSSPEGIALHTERQNLELELEDISSEVNDLELQLSKQKEALLETLQKAEDTTPSGRAAVDVEEPKYGGYSLEELRSISYDFMDKQPGWIKDPRFHGYQEDYAPRLMAGVNFLQTRRELSLGREATNTGMAAKNAEAAFSHQLRFINKDHTFESLSKETGVDIARIRDSLFTETLESVPKTYAIESLRRQFIDIPPEELHPLVSQKMQELGMTWSGKQWRKPSSSTPKVDPPTNKPSWFHGSSVPGWTPRDALNSETLHEWGQGLYLGVDDKVAGEHAKAVSNAYKGLGGTPSVYELKVDSTNTLKVGDTADKKIKKAFAEALKTEFSGEPVSKRFVTVLRRNENLTTQELFSHLEKVLAKESIHRGDEEVARVYQAINRNLLALGYDAMSDGKTLKVLDAGIVEVINTRGLDNVGGVEAVAARYNADSMTALNNADIPSANTNHIESAAKLQTQLLEETEKKLQAAKQKQLEVLTNLENIDDRIREVSAAERAKATERLGKQLDNDVERNYKKLGKTVDNECEL